MKTGVIEGPMSILDSEVFCTSLQKRVGVIRLLLEGFGQQVAKGMRRGNDDGVVFLLHLTVGFNLM